MSTGYVSEKFDTTRFQEEIEKIVEVLEAVKATIDDQTDVVWTNYNSPAEILADIDKHIGQLRTGDRDELGWVLWRFAPTGQFQELSISNGWGEEFLKLAEQIDFYVAKISKALPPPQ